MYNQKYIDGIGEKILSGIFNGNITFDLDKNNINYANQQIYFAFQHYLIKSFLSGQNRDRCLYYFEKYYNDFIEKPYLFCDSPLLKNGTIDNIFGNNNGDYLKKYRDRYYDYNKMIYLYKSSQSRELSNDEKNQYYSYLISLLRSNKNDNKRNDNTAFFESEIKKIIDTDFSKLNDMQLKFYCQYVSDFALRGHDYRATVMIGEGDNKSRGYNSEDYIFINKKAFTSIDMLTKTVCHESRHSVQKHDSRNNNTLAGFELAQRCLFSKYLDTKNYNSYKTNYRYSSIELDAEKSGHYDASVFFTMLGKHDLAEAVRNNRRKSTDERHFYGYMIGADDRPVSIDKFIVTNLDRIIKENPIELNSYPVLQNIYDSNGDKKSFVDLFKSKMKEDVSNRGILDNYINYGIVHNKLEEMSLDNPEFVQKYIKTLGNIYRSNAIQLNDYFKDNSNKYDSNQIAAVTNHNLLLSYKILSYVNSNYDLLATLLNDGKFDYNHPLFDFIYDLRDFDIKDIKNSAISNNPDLINKISMVKQMSDNISRKYNSSFVDERLKRLPDVVLNSNINIPGIGDVNFEYYFKTMVSPQMDGHKQVSVGGKKLYAGDLIVGCTKMVRDDLIKNTNSKKR